MHRLTYHALGCTPKHSPGEDPFQGTVRDITERKRADEALRESEHKFVTAFRHSPVALTITSALDDKYVDVNEIFLKDSGYDRDEIIGHTSAELQIFADNRDRETWLARVTEDGFVYSMETRFRMKSGKLVTCLVSTNIIHMAGQRHYLSTIVDIDQRKRAEEEREALRTQLLQSRKMEAIGTLAGGVAHDFNNLLTVILGYTDLLLQETDEKDPAYADLSKIMESARNGAEMVERLLMFGKKADTDPVPLDLNSHIRNAGALLARTLPKMVRIAIKPVDELGLVLADPAQMDQVVMNLAINANEAMPHGGVLTLKTSNVTLDGESCARHPEIAPGEYVLLSVSDTGTGMDKSIQERMFDPFFTMKGWSARKGTGLGLPSVLGIVQYHGGCIDCISEPGAGTTFNVYLPRLSAVPPADRETAAKEQSYQCAVKEVI